MSSIPQNDEQLREAVRTNYARAAIQALGTSPADKTACCGTNCCSPGTNQGDPISSDLYTSTELSELPVRAALASLGCGNPTALAELRPGEKVLDLGSGGGIDVLLSARRVGPTGFAYGLDMTDQMLELAERNRREAGIENVQFLKGLIEAIPLQDNCVDVIISNCVINLSTDKGQVLREAYRVLKPGGRFAISDIVFQLQSPLADRGNEENMTSPSVTPDPDNANRRPPNTSSSHRASPDGFAPSQIPAALRADLESWAGCIAGALEEETYRQLLTATGFTDIEVEVTRRYSLDEIGEGSAKASIAALSADERSWIDGKLVSAFIRARKPQGKE